MASLIIGLCIILLSLGGSGCTREFLADHDALSSHSLPAQESVEELPSLKTEDRMSQNLVSAEVECLPNQANAAALALQRLGFCILHIGPTISVQAPRSLWETIFNVSFEELEKTVMPETAYQVTYFRPVTDHFTIPTSLETVVSDVMFVEPPEFFQAPP